MPLEIRALDAPTQLAFVTARSGSSRPRTVPSSPPLMGSVVRHRSNPSDESAITSVGIGLATGLLLSLGTGKIITRWVQNAPHGPLIAVEVSLLVIFVAGLACLVPAMRALWVDQPQVTGEFEDAEPEVPDEQQQHAEVPVPRPRHRSESAAESVPTEN